MGDDTHDSHIRDALLIRQREMEADSQQGNEYAEGSRDQI